MAPSIHPFNLRHPGASRFRGTAFHQVALAALDASVQRRVRRREACRHFVSWQSDFNAGHNGSLIHPVGAPETAVHQKHEWEDYLTKMISEHVHTASAISPTKGFSRLPLPPRCIDDKQAAVWSIVWIFLYLAEGIVPCSCQKVLTSILHTVTRKMHVSTAHGAAWSP